MDEKTTQGRIEIGLIGKRVGPRLAILINRKQVLLTETSFRYLVGLILGKILNARNGGYISKYEADDVGENHWTYYQRMATEITSGLGGHLKHWWPIYESDKRCNYRLRGDVVFTFNWPYLDAIDDSRTAAMIKRMKAKKVREAAS